MSSMKIPSKDTTREYYIARRNVKGLMRYACYWTDTNAYVRDERTSQNGDKSFVYNPQIFSASYEKTLEKMRRIFPNAVLTEYAGTDATTTTTDATTTTGRTDVATMRGTVTTDIPDTSAHVVPTTTRNVRPTRVENPAYVARTTTTDVPATDDEIDAVLKLADDASREYVRNVPVPKTTGRRNTRRK